MFTFCDPRKISSMPLYINLKYKKEGEPLNTYFAQWKTENKWLMVELFRFVNKDQTTDVEVLLESFSRYYCGSLAIFVEGIEFRPVSVSCYHASFFWFGNLFSVSNVRKRNDII